MKKAFVLFVLVLFGTSVGFAQNFLGNPNPIPKELPDLTVNPTLEYIRVASDKKFTLGKISIFGNPSDDYFFLGGSFAYGKNFPKNFLPDSLNRLAVSGSIGYYDRDITSSNPSNLRVLAMPYANGFIEGADWLYGVNFDVNIPIGNANIFLNYTVESTDPTYNSKGVATSFDAGTRVSLLWKHKTFLDVLLGVSMDGTSNQFAGMGSFRSDSAKLHVNLGTSCSYEFSRYWKVRGDLTLGIAPKMFSSFDMKATLEGKLDKHSDNTWNVFLGYKKNADIFPQQSFVFGVSLSIH